jgi:predicted RNA-binding protein with PIN domain
VITRPDAARLGALPSRRWGALLPVLRTALHAVPEQSASAAVRRLRAAPASQLAGGRTRADLCRLVAEDDVVWDAVAAALDPLPPTLDWLADGWSPGADERESATAPGRGERGLDAEDLRAAREDAERLRARVREAVRERDDASRRLAGAEARADAATRRADDGERAVEALRAEVAELQARLAAAQDERRRAIDRDARRAATELDRLTTELRASRRAVAEAERERDAAVARAERAERPTPSGRAGGADDRTSSAPGRLRPGRPSRLPDGVGAATTEAAALLLHRDRLVLIDGYNVSLRHRPNLDLEAQRAWLVRTLATFVARVPIRPVVVFDGERGAGSRSLAPARGVEVRFTPAGVIADDEIVLAVEATDEPVVVVTDDRELRARVGVLGADLVATVNFLGVVGG